MQSGTDENLHQDKRPAERYDGSMYLIGYAAVGAVGTVIGLVIGLTL